MRIGEVLEHRRRSSDGAGAHRVTAHCDGDVAVGRPLARPHLPGDRKVRVGSSAVTARQPPADRLLPWNLFDHATRLQ